MRSCDDADCEHNDKGWSEGWHVDRLGER